MQRCANCNRTLKALLCSEQPRWLSFFAIPRPWRPCVNLLTWMASLYTPPARVVLALPVVGGLFEGRACPCESATPCLSAVDADAQTSSCRLVLSSCALQDDACDQTKSCDQAKSKDRANSRSRHPRLSSFAHAQNLSRVRG